MPKILQNHYVLAAQDARAEADFYIEKLGFSEWGDADEAWEMREFTVRTPSGHRFKIGQWIGGEK
jgi:hypothetical protein